MIPPHLTDNIALYVVGTLALVLIGVLAMVMRAIVRGDLVPKATVESNTAELRDRIAAQASALVALTNTNSTLVTTNATQADSISDLADAAHLQVRIGEALHKQLEEA
ncbi:hypothetical protein [Gordonia insulae]|uniref:Uncharacterized protein n=1 Tax=Gordonia insulae TaxID=2420509 RepID=A0A3G8JEC7_9ACTN|nr:hypothetical protein [Gordonia insulae]AZG43437.1 hypothetical protein D7316_00001 [Gordonia insulae]